MFNSKSNKSALGSEEFSINSIGKGTVVKGNISAPGDIRIDGTLEGDLNCDARVILGSQGSITGDVSCADAFIYGNLAGSLKVQNTLEVGSTAHINGKVSTKKLIIEEGAIFNVICEMLTQQGTQKEPSNGKA